MAKKKRNREETNRKVVDISSVREEKESTNKKANRSGKRHFIYALAFTVILAIVGLTAYKLVTLHVAAEAANARLEALEAERQRLAEELEMVNDPKYIEQKAREELRMIMPGETLYVVDMPEEEEETEEGS